jgi:hypothetical protein
VLCARERSGIFSGDYLPYRLFHDLERLPVAARGQRIAVFAVLFVMLRVGLSRSGPA